MVTTNVARKSEQQFNPGAAEFPAEPGPAPVLMPVDQALGMGRFTGGMLVTFAAILLFLSIVMRWNHVPVDAKAPATTAVAGVSVQPWEPTPGFRSIALPGEEVFSVPIDGTVHMALNFLEQSAAGQKSFPLKAVKFREKSDYIGADSARELDQFAVLLRAYTKPSLLIEPCVFTDGKLAEKRIDQVRRFMIAKQIDPARIKTVISEDPAFIANLQPDCHVSLTIQQVG